jgi:prophage DNA circulation protein
MAWADDLEQAMFRGVTFDVESIDDTIERRVVEHKFPYRDGAKLEDTGRDPRPFDFEAFFLGDDYLERLIPFLQVCDEGATGLLVHPLFGSFQAKVISARINHDASRRNFASVSVQFKEDATDTVIPDFSGVQAAQEDLINETETMISESEDLALITPPEETNWLDLVNRAAADAAQFAEDIDSLAEDLETRFEQARKTLLDAIDETTAMADRAVEVATSQATPIIQSMQRTVLAAKRLRERTERIKSKVVELPIAATAPLSTLALRLYGDAKRESDLIRINNVRNPFLVEPGTRLRVYQE